MAQYPALARAAGLFFSYGLGWFIQDYRGQQMWMHTGSIDGMCAIIGLLPNQRIGVYILENLDHAELRHGLMYAAFDLYGSSSGAKRDWSAELKTLFAHPTATPAAAPRATMPPSLPLERYVGTYVDSTYGDVRVTLANGVLQAQIVTDPVTPLQAATFETFRTRPADAARDPSTLTFMPDGAGGVSAVRALGITFARVRAPR
jgi:hypothetical protein